MRLQATLQRQYYAVLTEPQNEAKRVDLARTQIQYKVTDQAVYNLKRAGVVDQESFDRYQIDGSVLEEGASPVNRLYLERQRVVGPVSGFSLLPFSTEAEQELPPVERRTTETDLALIAAGRAKAALEGIEYRLEERTGGSRDFYALGKAYASLGLEERALPAVRRALYYTTTRQPARCVGGAVVEGLRRTRRRLRGAAIPGFRGRRGDARRAVVR